MSSALIIKGMAKLRGFWRESWVCLGLKARLAEVEYPAYMSFAKDLLSNHWFCFQIRGDFGNIFGNNRQFARFVSKLDLFLETFLETSVAAPLPKIRVTEIVTKMAKSVTDFVIFSPK